MMPVFNCPPTPTPTLKKTFNQNCKNPKSQNPLEKAYGNHLSSPNSSLICTTRVSSQNQSNLRSTDVEQGHLIIQVHQTFRVKSNPQVRCTQILKDKQTPSIPDESLVYSSKRLNSSQNQKPQIKHTRTGHLINIIFQTLHIGSDENFGPSSCLYPICSLLLVREEVSCRGRTP